MKLQMNHSNTDKNRTALVDAGVGVGVGKGLDAADRVFHLHFKIAYYNRENQRGSLER